MKMRRIPLPLRQAKWLEIQDYDAPPQAVQATIGAPESGSAFSAEMYVKRPSL
jgi:hypothetical protein